MYFRYPGLAVCLLAITSCGSDGYAPCEQQLTSDYVTSNFAFIQSGITISDTMLIHEDGDQGGTFDIDRIMLSRASHESGDSLALAYSLYASSTPSADTYVAFYFDSDGNSANGVDVGSFKADTLILDDMRILGVHSHYGHNGFYKWDSVDGWVVGTTLGAELTDIGFVGDRSCSPKIAIHVPLYAGLSTLYGNTSLTGVMKLVRFSGGDPNSLLETIDETTTFPFDVP